MASPPETAARRRSSPPAPILRSHTALRSQRPPRSPFRSGKPTHRRAVVAALVACSLLLITVSFRESDDGAVHAAQSAGASVLRPLEVAVERVTQPFRDLYGWADGLVGAKSENERLRRELKIYKQLAIQGSNAIELNETLRRQLRYLDGDTYPRDYTWISAAVITGPPNPFDQQVTIEAGASDGIRKYDPVITPDGLVGQVDRVAETTSRVKLLIDPSSYVSARSSSGADGVIRHSGGTGDSLSLALVQTDEPVEENDLVVTSGWRSRDLSSTLPKNLPIGVVTDVGRTDTDLYTQVQVDPYVDFSELDAVIVLRKRNRP